MPIAYREWRDLTAHGQRCLQWLPEFFARESSALAHADRAVNFAIDLL